MLLYIMQQIELSNLICKFINFMFLVIKVYVGHHNPSKTAGERVD
jgi:hypothetical protein